MRNRPCPAQASNGLADYDRLAQLQVSCNIWALQLGRFRDDRMRHSCWQVCRPGSVAARWEYRNNPVIDLEKVRGFAMRHACTQPSLCPIVRGRPIELDRSRTVGAVERRSLRRRRVRRRCRLMGGGGGHLFGHAEGVPPPLGARARTRASSAPSRLNPVYWVN